MRNKIKQITLFYPIMMIIVAFFVGFFLGTDKEKIFNNMRLEVTDGTTVEDEGEMSNSTLYYKMLELEEAYSEMNVRISEERFEEIDERIEEAKKQGKLESFPVGSIYTSTDSRNPSSYIGGTWERYGKGRALVGVDEDDTTFSTVNKEVGHKELQAHTHTVAAHTHTVTGTAASAGAHTHTVITGMLRDNTFGKGTLDAMHNSVGSKTYTRTTSSAGAHTHTVSGTAASGGGGNTGSTGTGDSGNIQPSITVYFWKRTA